MPQGVTMTFCELEFGVGGEMHFANQSLGKEPMWFKYVYREIIEGEELVVEQHRSDEAGSERDSPEWPASVIALRLEDLDGKTRLTVVHKGMVSERATVDDHRQGWSESRAGTAFASIRTV